VTPTPGASVTDHRPPDDPVEDRDLLARLDRDSTAFEAFYRRHVDRIAGFAVRRCDGPEEVADLVAAVFLAVIESAHRYDPARGEPISWLFGVAANQLRMHRRGSWRQRGIAVRVSGQRLLAVDDVARIEERIDAERLAPDVRRAIARLPRGERAVFELVSREGLTAAQAGQALAISPAAVRVRLSRARAKLRVELGEALDPDPPERALHAVPATTFRAHTGPTTTEEVAL
jgi:RNA polymerase sigma factor (sigma-70 family)